MSTELLIPKEPGTRRCYERQRTKALIRKLITLAKNYPEFRPLLEAPVLVLKHESDRALVLHKIHTGAWTVKDLQRETQLSRAGIQRILDLLVATKIIFTSPTKQAVGPPIILYLPSPNFQPVKK